MFTMSIRITNLRSKDKHTVKVIAKTPTADQWRESHSWRNRGRTSGQNCGTLLGIGLRTGNNQVQRLNAFLGLPGARRQAVLEGIPRSDTVSHPAPRQRARTSHPPSLNSIPGDGRTKESLGFTFPPRHRVGSAWLIEPRTLSLQFPAYLDASARRDHGLFAQSTGREEAWPVAAWLRALEFGWKAFIDRKQRWIARCLRSIEMQANGNRRGLYSTLKASNGSIEAA
jgi:hypothetical protein